MSLSGKEKKEFFELLYALREEIATDEQVASLNALIVSNPRICRLYVDYMKMCGYFRVYQLAGAPRTVQAGHLDCSSEVEHPADITDALFWADLAEHERTAPAVEIPKENKSVELITDIRKRKAMLKSERKKVPFSLWVSLVSLAAMLVMMAYVMLNPRVMYEVATVSDSFQTQWSSPLAPQKGTRLAASSEQIVLHRGFIQIETDKDVQLFLEAPATFRFLSPDEVFLYQGRLLAHVPESGSGFSVRTNASKIIDLGTKFGVYAEMNDDTELHLFTGQALLIAGTRQGGRHTAEIVAGRAVRVDHTGRSITDVPLREDIFVHGMDSQTGFLWRGQSEINLADVVGGGNGFGTGVQGVGINPASGVIRNAEARTQRHSNVYTAVESNVFIDGVFVPNGADKQIVTTARHVFAECPPTSGYYFMDIAHTTMARVINDQQPYSLYLNQTNYSLPENPSIFMHANTGITFDLSQFRSRLTETRILRFRSEFGISDSAPTRYIADFWILLDGRVRYTNAEPMRRGDAVDIDIEISDQDRFLTLMVTDGSVHDHPQDENAIGSDWGVFGRPFLILE